jgi:ketosteroid isomerase-like protein
VPRTLLSIAVASCLVLAGPVLAAPSPRDEVAARHALEREAHMDRNVELLLSLFADDFVMVDGGQVQRPTLEEQRQRFTAYFGAVRFHKWDDLVAPVIHVSTDGTLASVVVQKEVVLVLADAPADAKAERAVFAWIETWAKRRGRWQLVAMASTRAVDSASTP